MIHTYLFMADRELIYRYKVRDLPDGQAEYELARYSNDETARRFSEDFWQAWKEDSAFTDGDSIDAALLSDDGTFQLDIPPGIPVCNPTHFFTKNRIRRFFERDDRYSHVTLTNDGREETIKNRLDVLHGERRRFFLTIFFPAEEGNGFAKSPQDSEYTLGVYFDEKKEKWNKETGAYNGK